MYRVYLDIFVGALMLTCIFSNSLSEPMKFRFKLLLFATVLFCYSFMRDQSLVTFLTITLFLLIIAFSTKNRLVNAIAALAGYILSVVSNYILLLLTEVLFDIDVATLYSKLTYQISFYIVYFILAYVLTYLLGCFMKNHFSPGLSVPYRHTIRLIFLEVLLCSSILVYNITYGRQIGYPSQTIVFNCILFFVYFVLSTTLLLHVVHVNKKLILSEQKEQQYAQLQDYMHNLEQTSMKLREFKHDYINTLLTLDALIHIAPSDSDFEAKHAQLITYFDQNIKPDSEKIYLVDTQFIGLSKLKDSGLKSLISSKLSLASLEQIDIRIEMADEVSQIPMNPMDIARIIGIFLDNAIEEAIALSKALSHMSNHKPQALTPFIHVAFIQMGDCLQIVVENSCSLKEIPLEKIAEYGYSTKGTTRGYGLYETTQLLSQYKNVIHKTTHHNNVFTQTLLIYSVDK